jgi:TolA-binding protein
VLYEMTTGQRTFQGSTSAVIFDAILNREPLAPIDLNANVPLALERIIARLLEKDPQRRYRSASEIRVDLQQMKQERSSGAVRSWPQTPATTSQRSGSQWPSSLSGQGPSQSTSRASIGAWLIASLGIVSLAAASWLYVQSGSRPEPLARVTTVEVPASQPALAATESIPPAPSTPVAPAVPRVAVPPPVPEPRRPAASTQPAAMPANSAPASAPAIKVSDPLADQIGVARAKADAKLYDQAQADLRAGLAAAPSSPSAPAAHLLLGTILQRQGRADDAMAAYVELRSRHGNTAEAAEGTFLLADLTVQSRRSDREEAARRLFSEVPGMTGSAPWAVQALQRRAALEERARLRVVDTTLGTTVPASLLSYRQLVESYPDSPAVEPSLARGGEIYEDLPRYELAAQAWFDLARRFPDNARDAAWQAGELFEKRARDLQRAREAYGLVPARSSHYRDAQTKLGR